MACREAPSAGGLPEGRAAPGLSYVHAGSDFGSPTSACSAGSGWPAARAYARWLGRHQRALRWGLAAAFAVGCALAPAFLRSMATTVPATAGTYSDVANSAIRAHFPGKIADVVAAVVVSRVGGGPVLGEEGLGESVVALTRHVQEELSPLSSPTLAGGALVSRVDSWLSFQGVREAQRSFVSSDGTTSALLVNYNIAADRGRLLPAVRAALASSPTRGELETLLTGIQPLDEAASKGAVNNFKDMDSIAFPAALVLLGPVLRSWKLMLLPIAGIVFAAVLSFGILMYPISFFYDIFILAGSLMMSLLIAVSIDYALFILSRYRAELEARSCEGQVLVDCAEAAVATTIETAGHAVLVSGTTLTLAFAGLILSFDPFLVSVGLSCSAAVVAAMASALLVTPVLLLSWPAFFGAAAPAPRKRRGPAGARELADVSLSQAFELTEEGAPEAAGAELLEQEVASLVSTRWFRFSAWMLSHRLAVLAVVAVAFAPALLRLPHMEVSRSPMQLVPRGHEAGLGFARLLDKFGAGMLWPTKVLVLPPPGETVFSESFFKRVASVVESLPSQLPLSPRYSVQSLVYSSDAGGAVPFATVRAALPELRDAGHGDGAELLCDVAAGAVGMDACQLIRLARQKFVNANGTAMVLNIALDSDPWTPASTRWLHSLRRACEIFGGSTDQYLVVSNPSSVSDTVDGVYASAPLVILVTGCGVFAIVSASFRSVVVPLRLLPSIALTIIWTYGLAVMVYQDGVLAGLGISCLSPIGHGGIPGVSWVLPPICFTLLTGLCLDYDIFVLARIVEFRLAGYADRDAVLLGVSASGPTITVAGCIMMVAFSGLMMSDQLLLNELSFILLACVVIDTFVVRNIVVPLCMDVLGGLSNWWPRRMPEPCREIPCR